MLRIGLFLLTNVAIIAVVSIIFSVLGLQGTLQQNGVDLDLRALIIISLVWGFAGSFISLLMSKFVAKRAMRVKVIGTPANPGETWLVETVRRQAAQAEIGMPEVGVFDHPSPNAFATGWNRNNALVAVSTGLFHAMDKSEVEAVLGHEVSHVANGDMVTLALLQGVVNAFVIFFARVIGHVVDRVVFRTQRGHGPGFWIVSILAQIVLGILASVVVMWFSRRREFSADRGGAELAGRQNMINALKRLKGDQHAAEIPDEMRAFAINAGRMQAVFSSHPPLDRRIAALEAGGGTGGSRMPKTVRHSRNR